MENVCCEPKEQQGYTVQLTPSSPRSSVALWVRCSGLGL